MVEALIIIIGMATMFFIGVRKGQEDFIYTLTNCTDESFKEIIKLFKKAREQEPKG